MIFRDFLIFFVQFLIFFRFWGFLWIIIYFFIFFLNYFYSLILLDFLVFFLDVLRLLDFLFCLGHFEFFFGGGHTKVTKVTNKHYGDYY